MEKPIVAATSPQAIQLEKGKSYAWCTCGKSQNQPLCDGSHRSTSFRPRIFKAEQDGEAWLCRCKQTRNAPFCDGTHNHL
jgi:CDGSH-type Zn-finger protein